MADQHQEQRRRLDVTGSREVVYCHHCENEWYRDEHGLVCPGCDGEVTEIISAENDPRRPEVPAPLSANELRGLREHDPWEHHDHDSDPEEGDIREFLRENPQGRTTFISRTFRGPPREVFASGSPRRQPNPDEPASQTLRDFEGIISSILGPNTRTPGAQSEYRNEPSPFVSPDMTPGWGNIPTANAPNDQQPRIFGGRVTFQFGGGPLRTFNTNEDQGPQQQDINTYAPPSQRTVTIHVLVFPTRGEDPNEVSSILRDLMLVIQPPGNGADNTQNPLGGLHGLFAGLLNPANAVSGDAVYSQEALDRIISTLMEQHPTSNAPGPAPAEAIASLPKKKIDDKMLGPEGKAECSVCMDDVVLDEEVVTLPCSHWFHETCVKAWLSEHNTCPICRTGVARDGTALPAGSNTPASPGHESGQSNNNPFEGLEGLPPYSRRSTFLRRRPSINETRLASIRNVGGRDSEQNGQGEERGGLRTNAGTRRERSLSPPSHIPGAFSSSNNRNTILRREESDTDAGSASRRYHERNMERERSGNSEVDRGSDRGRPDSEHSNISSNSMGGTIGSWFRRFSGGGNGRRND